MQIQEKFKKAETVKDINIIARSLKEEGCDAAEVNKCAAERRKELLIASSKQGSKLKKAILPLSSDTGSKFASFNVKPLHIADNMIAIHADYTEI